MSNYPSLNRAQLSYDYLHTNSTTHEFLFGAIVELVDNSRDANAERCDIFTITRNDLRGGRMLCFIDNGCGMTPTEAKAVMTFGYSAKRRDPSMIGQYGNGLKSGAMRIGKDLILFTKKDDIRTCVFLSRTFHEDENIDEVIVPAPSFDKTNKPLLHNDTDVKKHELEMEIILKYSPYRTKEDLMLQFDMIKELHGTLVVVYNLKLLENSEPELDFVTDPTDIRLSDPEGSDSSDSKFHQEKGSLRSYLSVIYADPRMKLYIQNKKVRTRRIISCLYKVRVYKYSSAKFKARAEKQIQEAKDHLITAQDRAKESESKLADFERKHGSNPTNKDIRTQWRQLQDRTTVSRLDVKRLRDLTDEKIKQLKEPKIISFMFGINLERRTHDGCFIYNNGRLIRMYEKVGAQLDGTKKCCGVVGVVDIPFVVLEPTHNKQDFADSREYRQLLRAMGEHMEQYWRDLNLAAQPGGLLQFWHQFGYVSNDWTLPPSDDDKFIKKRLMSVNLTLQCDLCLKWRILPYDSKQSKTEFLDTWTCSQNPDPVCNKCSAPEKIVNFPVGKLEKELVTVDQKRDLLEKKIQKQQAELSQLAKLTNVNSKKDIAVADSRSKQNSQVTQSPTTRKSLPSRRVRSPSPSPSSPPVKKPRTKADLRRQMQSKSSSEENDDDDDDDEEEEENESSPTRQISSGRPASMALRTSRSASTKTKSPSKPVYASSSRQSSAVATRMKSLSSLPPIPKKPTDTQPSKNNSSTVLSKSNSASTVSSKNNAITVALDKSPAGEKKILSVERLEAHSTNQNNNDEQLSPMVSSSNGGPASIQDELVGRLRRFLYYFLPPNWNKLTKPQVGQLTAEELLKVDLPEFFQAYECGLKKLVADHQKTADTAQQHLRRLRNITSTIVKHLKPDFELETGCETETVDQVLEKFIRKEKL